MYNTIRTEMSNQSKLMPWWWGVERFGAGCVKVSEELLLQCEYDLSAVKCNDNDSRSGVSADNFCENWEYSLFTECMVWGEREVVCQKLWCQISAEQVH